MNNINSIRNCYKNSFNSNKTSVNLSTKTLNKDINFNNQYITSEISFASRIYGLALVNNKTIPQMSLKDLLKWLESQNKVEGKDFKVNLDISDVTMMNKYGQEEFVVHYDNGNHDFWESYESYEYKNNKLYKSVLRDKENNISLITQIYNNDDIEIEHLLDFTYGTSPEEFLKTLKDRNIDCDIEYFDAKNKLNNANINVYDENKKNTDKYSFYYSDKFDEQCSFVTKNEYNQKGQIYRSIIFNKDTTEVTLII